MSVKIVTYFGTLMRLAHAEGQARLSGDAEALAKAEAEHEAYRSLCLIADEMIIDV